MRRGNDLGGLQRKVAERQRIAKTLRFIESSRLCAEETRRYFFSGTGFRPGSLIGSTPVPS
jgi:hypothetical protein